jgi:hypothetical protein
MTEEKLDDSQPIDANLGALARNPFAAIRGFGTAWAGMCAASALERIQQQEAEIERLQLVHQQHAAEIESEVLERIKRSGWREPESVVLPMTVSTEEYERVAFEAWLAEDEISVHRYKASGCYAPASTECMWSAWKRSAAEHRRVIASLGAALRKLSFYAQTTGGTAGPDAGLQEAIAEAARAMSFSGITAAMVEAAPEYRHGS